MFALKRTDSRGAGCYFYVVGRLACGSEAQCYIVVQIPAADLPLMVCCPTITAKLAHESFPLVSITVWSLDKRVCSRRGRVERTDNLRSACEARRGATPELFHISVSLSSRSQVMARHPSLFVWSREGNGEANSL